MNNRRLSHEEVREAVTTYFTQIGFTVDIECDIQFGAGKDRKNGSADVVVKNPEGYWVAIVECKSGRIRRTLEGEWQLKSYLSATDTRFGILAASRDPADWVYFENLRSNVFQIRERHVFNARLNDSPRADRPDQDAINQLKADIEQLEADNNQLKTDNEQLEADNNQLETDNNQLKQNFNLVKYALISTVVIAVGISVYFLILRPIQNQTDTAQNQTNPTQSQTDYKVIRVIDGDTFDIIYEDQTTSVQLVGVDTPETKANPTHPPEPYGEEATAFLREFVLDKSIYLRFDVSKRDKYNRLLGYVYRTSDDIFVNLEIIREGYGEVDKRYPFKYEELFTDYESRAKTDRKGLWSSSFR